MLLKACLNGARKPGDHPALPLTPAELAADAVAAARAGAGAVHVHPRDETGRESLLAGDVGAAVAAIRAARPGLPVGVTTGLWITEGDPERRLDEVRGWAHLPPPGRPDFASVNLGEPGFAELATVLRAAGVAVEAGVWTVDDAETLGAAGLPGSAGSAGPLLRVLVEVMDAPAADAPAYAERVLARLDDLGTEAPHLLHGEDEAAWPVLDLAASLGLATRIGLEDVLVGPDGSPVSGNSELVALARARLTGDGGDRPG